MSKLFSLIVFISAALFLALSWETEAHNVRSREAPAPAKNASQVLEEAFESLKKGVDDFVKNVQNNELYQNVSQSLKNFGEQVQNQGKQLVDKIQQSTKSSN